MQADAGAFGVIKDAALAISDGKIAWLGAKSDLPEVGSVETRSLAGRWLTPALIDCHTHLVFAGNRAQEFERRLGGASYEEIAREGGGIISTVNATRAASVTSLIESATNRLDALMRDGVATIEIKSGYGLNRETELVMLEVARAIADKSKASVVTTFLGAHSIPPEFKGRADDYIDLLTSDILPAAHEKGLVDAVDAYCESIAFSTKFRSNSTPTN